LNYQGAGFAINYPDNWEVRKTEDGVILAPQGAILEGEGSESAQAFGASITLIRSADLGGEGWGLVDATDKLLDSMRRSNPNLRVTRQTGFKLQGRPALSTLFENDSPIEGQKEKDRLVTVNAGGGLMALILIAPDSAIAAYTPTFDAMVRSFELR